MEGADKFEHVGAVREPPYFSDMHIIGAVFPDTHLGRFTNRPYISDMQIIGAVFPDTNI